MISPQTLGQIAGLTRKGVNRAFYNTITFEKKKGFFKTHSRPHDPLRSLTPPTLRLKGVSDTDHGVESKKEIGGGSYGVGGVRYGNRKLGTRKGLKTCLSRLPRNLTLNVKYSQRSLDG